MSGVPDWFHAAITSDIARDWIEVEGASIEVLSGGRRGAPGLLFMHGFRAHADWWSHRLPLFTDRYRVACLSWSGMGRSSWRDQYGLDQHLREAIAAAEMAGLFEAQAKPRIVAHSFSGHMAAIAAAEHGDRFQGAVIIDSSIRPKRGPWPNMGGARFYPSYEVARGRFRLAPPQACLPFVADWFARHALKEVADGPEKGKWTWRFDPELRAKLIYREVWDLLARPGCPIAFLRGARSNVVSEGLADLQKAQIPPGSPYIVVPDAAHHLMADQPLALVQALNDLLAVWPS